MRHETITKTYLKFKELNELQKNKVIQKLSYINVNHPWYESECEYYSEKLKKLGFYDIKFEFSGFHSQGDGASFSAKHKRGVIYKVGRYSHSGYMRCDESEVLLSVAKRIANKLYKSLNDSYTYLTSCDAIIETIEVNDYEFDSETLNII